MKKAIITIIVMLGILNISKAITITKTAGNLNPRVGEVFEYTVNISGISNLNELGKVTDNLNSNLTYIGSDFATTSTVVTLYNLACPGSAAALSATNVGGFLTFQFPNSCTGIANGSGISFKIKVALNANACNAGTIDNVVSLSNVANTSTITSPVCSIVVDHSNPWTLKKSFRSYTGGYLIYDVRLTSAVAEYSFNTLPVTAFVDTFEVPDCFGATVAGSEVVYIPDESNLSATIDAAETVSAITGGLQFDWMLPISSGPPFNSSFLYQVKIKVNCTCPESPTFDLLNNVKFTATDICGNTFTLEHQFDMTGATCDGPPEQLKCEMNKKVMMDNNDLNLTMKGCTGKYVINIKNCTVGYDYTGIHVTDNIPTGILPDFTSVVITPAVYTSDFTSAGTGFTLNSTNTLAPGNTLTIEIPFTVTEPLPNVVIQNCANVSVVGDNHINPPVTISENLCDKKIKTIPNSVEVSTFKRICNPPIRSCGSHTINSNLPGDTVEYALHFYNYGTGEGQGVELKDVLPPYFSFINAQVYKTTGSGSYLYNTCDVSSLTEITTEVSIMPSGQLVAINFGPTHKLDAFTCNGVTHYVVKMKAKINMAVPNGSYPNSFSVKYNEAGSAVQNWVLSNTVTSVVNKDALIIMNKTVDTIIKDCYSKIATIKYKVRVVNMGMVPITINVKDNLNIPSPIAAAPGFVAGSLQYSVSPSGPVSPTAISTAPSPTTHSLTPSLLKINLFTLPGCNAVTFTYDVKVNFNLLAKDSSKLVCNNATVTAGYMSTSSAPNYAEYSDIVMSKNTEFINSYLGENTISGKYQWQAKMTAERKKSGFQRYGIPIEKHPKYKVFIAIDTLTIGACTRITDCLNGDATGCIKGQGSGYLDLKILGMNASNQLMTTLTIAPAAPKISKIEYVLSDVRMITPVCPPLVKCFSCSPSATGLFTTSATAIGGVLFYSAPAVMAGSNYRENNMCVFQSAMPQAVTGTINKDFKLPVANTNCNGTIELVLTAIVYFEDCSICYVSKSFDHNYHFNWIFDPIGTGNINVK